MATKKWSDDELITLLRPDMDGAEAIQDALKDQRKEYYDLYRMQPYGNEREGYSKTVAATVFSAHRWTMANLMDIFTEDFFVLKGQDDKKASALQKLVYYQMFKKQDGFRKFYENMFNASLYHYSVMKVCYKDDFALDDEKYDQLTAQEMEQLAAMPDRHIAKYDEVTLDTGEVIYNNVKVVVKRTNYSGPVMEVIPPWEFYYSNDSKMTDWGGIEGRLVYHKVQRSLNEIRKREKAGIYKKGTYDKVKGLTSIKTEDNFSDDRTEVMFNADDLPNYDTQEPSNQKDNILSTLVSVKECYFNLDIDGDGLLEPVVIDVIADAVIARIELNPYKHAPFRIGHILPEPHKINGISLPSILDNDQKVETNLIRLVQDSGAMDCYRNPVTSDPQMLQHLQNRKPFMPIKGDPKTVGVLETGAPSQFILKAYEMLKASNEEKTGITRYNQGMDASSLNKTATGIDAIMSASAKPLRLIAKIIGNGQIKGIIKDFIYINQKWPDQFTMQALQVELNPNMGDLEGDFDIDIDIGVSAAEKNAMANQMDLFVQFATQAGMQMGIVDPIGVMRAQKKKYALLNIKMDDCMKSEADWTKEQQAKAQQPPEPADLKQYVALDKLFPYLTPIEQAQILEHFQIQPDPRRQSMPATAMSGENPIDLIRLENELRNPKQIAPPAGGMPQG